MKDNFSVFFQLKPFLSTKVTHQIADFQTYVVF